MIYNIRNSNTLTGSIFFITQKSIISGKEFVRWTIDNDFQRVNEPSQ